VGGAEIALRRETAKFISVHSICKAEQESRR